MFSLCQKQYPRGVRTATRTLVMVVGCYFIPNFAATLVNLWEYFVPQALGRTHYYAYLLAVDTAYLVSTIQSSVYFFFFIIFTSAEKRCISYKIWHFTRLFAKWGFTASFSTFAFCVYFTNIKVWVFTDLNAKNYNCALTMIYTSTDFPRDTVSAIALQLDAV